MYDTAYHRSAKLKPNKLTENISGLMSGKAIIRLLVIIINLVSKAVKTKK